VVLLIVTVFTLNCERFCSFNQHTYDLPVNRTIQVIQLTAMDFEVGNCLVILSRRGYKCSKYSLNSEMFGPQVMEFETNVIPTALECKQMLVARVVTLDGRTMPLNESDETKVIYASHGQYDNNGWCQGADFIRKGVTYNRFVEITEVS